MLDIIWDYLKSIFKSRVIPIVIIYSTLFVILVYRLFQLQIVDGQDLVENPTLRNQEIREVKSTRANIYDRNGILLASNELSYAIIMEDSTKVSSNDDKNAIIHKLIQLIEKSGDTIDLDFYLMQNDAGILEFTVEENALTKFKKNVYAYDMENNQLSEEQENATPKDVYEFLKHGIKAKGIPMFGISDDYTIEETLKIMSIRYALFINYPKYYQITVASNINDLTLAAVKENGAELIGVDIQQQTKRVYHDSVYFSHMLGYTGLINSDELENYEETAGDYYNSTDIIGKSGLEKEFEATLGGSKGSETVTVNSAGRVVEIVDYIDPVAGNDLYLTIDSKLQKQAYHLLENEIKEILLDKITPNMDYGSKGESSSEILIPIYEVYYALINNNIIDVSKLDRPESSMLEKTVYGKYMSERSTVFSKLDSLLAIGSTVTNTNAGDMEDYLSLFYRSLVTNGLLNEKSIPEDNVVYISYVNNRISLSEFLLYAIGNNWVNLEPIAVGDDYYSAEELYLKVVSYVKKSLETDTDFNDNIYRSLIFLYKLSGKEICLLLFDQGVLKSNETEVRNLNNGASAYEFIRRKIESLEISPGMLGLDPCSGSIVVTDVNNGDVLAMVTYPSYDNNMFANKVDSAYYNQVYGNSSYPSMNRPTVQKFAPGSTFKMITAVAALEEGVIQVTDKIRDLSEFTKISPAAKCHIHPGSHGLINVSDAIKVSCNYFFYELGWRLSMDSNNRFRDNLGLSKLEDYATLFGLNMKSGVEVGELSPQISNDDPVRSAIGQGKNSYTPVQLSRYVSTIANGGKSFNLTLVDKVVDKDGKVIEDHSAVVVNDVTSIKESTWKAVKQGMYSVVNETGGSVYEIYKDMDLAIAGKTGTAQTNTSRPNHALFLSYAPFEKPEISVTTVIPNGYTSINSARVTKGVYQSYYNLEVTKEDNNTTLAIE